MIQHSLDCRSVARIPDFMMKLHSRSLFSIETFSQKTGFVLGLKRSHYFSGREGADSLLTSSSELQWSHKEPLRKLLSTLEHRIGRSRLLFDLECRGADYLLLWSRQILQQFFAPFGCDFDRQVFFLN